MYEGFLKNIFYVFIYSVCVYGYIYTHVCMYVHHIYAVPKEPEEAVEFSQELELKKIVSILGCWELKLDLL